MLTELNRHRHRLGGRGGTDPTPNPRRHPIPRWVSRALSRSPAIRSSAPSMGELSEGLGIRHQNRKFMPVLESAKISVLGASTGGSRQAGSC